MEVESLAKMFPRNYKSSFSQADSCLKKIVDRPATYFVLIVIVAVLAAANIEVFSWPGIGEPLKWQSERTGIENKWFALTGRFVELKVEEDGDLYCAARCNW